MTKAEAIGTLEAISANRDDRLNELEKAITSGVVYNASVETLKNFNEKQQERILEELTTNQRTLLYELFAEEAIEKAFDVLNRIEYV